MKLFLTAAFFCVVAATACVSAMNGPALSCCLTVSDTKVHPKNIVNYTVQRIGLCPVEAVVFHTCKGKTVCTEAGRDWVLRAMDKVDKRKAGKAAQSKACCQKRRRKLCN